MKIKLNPDQKIVNTIREGLKRTADTVPAAENTQRQPNVCARSLRIKLQIPASKDSATVCSITNPCRIKGGTLCCQRNWLP